MTMPIHDCRSIDQRHQPPVGGVDLEHALNYIEVEHVGPTFCYQHYTASQVFYKPGQRLTLEAFVRQLSDMPTDPAAKIKALAESVATTVRWAGYYQKHIGHPLPKDLAATEEQILERGYGWCNEQARLFCGLTQILGFASRLVFAVNKTQQIGHCLSEVFLGDQWLTVDQTFGYCFFMHEVPIRAVDLKTCNKTRQYFNVEYRRLFQGLIADLGREPLIGEFDMALASDPITAFDDLGFHNYYLH